MFLEVFNLNIEIIQRVSERKCSTDFKWDSKLTSVQIFLRLLQTFAGVLREKIRTRAILKENTENNGRFGGKCGLEVICIPQKKIVNNLTAKMTVRHSIEF